MTKCFSIQTATSLLVVSGILLLLTGCASEQLRVSTDAEGSSVVDVNYNMVLNNIAQQVEEPNRMPWAIQIAGISTATNDTGGISAGYGINARRPTAAAGISGSRVTCLSSEPFHGV